MMTGGLEVLCDVCGAKAMYRENKAVYGRNYGNVPYIWLCPSCGAYVGTHPDRRPLGKLAGTATHAARKEAHAAFDPLWNPEGSRRQFDSRSAAYRWLAEALGISRNACHIGKMDTAMCRRVIEVCQGR